jgi:hypothetical protein
VLTCELLWTLWRRETVCIVSYAGNWTMIHLFSVPNALPWLQFWICVFIIFSSFCVLYLSVLVVHFHFRLRTAC